MVYVQLEEVQPTHGECFATSVEKEVSWCALLDPGRGSWLVETRTSLEWSFQLHLGPLGDHEQNILSAQALNVLSEALLFYLRD